jgi:hypothetical protein
MIRRHLARSGLALLAVAAATLPAAGQSVFASRGLGYPLEPVDARARAMGGITAGGFGSFFSVVNPAAIAGVPAPAASVTYQNDWYEASAEGMDAKGTTARFPVIALAFPIVGRWSAALAYGSFLDQNWGATVTDSMDLSSGRVEVTDRFTSTGGVARLRAGAAYQVSSRLAVGVAGELYTGVVRDTLLRFVGDLTPAAFSTSYSFSGTGGSAGVRWNPVAALTLSGAVSGGGKLRAVSEDSLEERRDYTLPLTLDAGVSARIARQAEVAASVRWAGWADANEELAARGGARDQMVLAAGVEYGGLRLLRAPVPIRLGARLNQLPFRWEDGEFPEERALTGGFGLGLARGAAQMDFAAERGVRGGDAAGAEEPYWRAVITMSILGR